MELTAEPGILAEPDAVPGAADRSAAWGPSGAVHIHLARTRPVPPEAAVRSAPPIVIDAITLPTRCLDDAAGEAWEVGDDTVGGRVRLTSWGASVVAWDAEGRWASTTAAVALRFLAMEAMRGCGLVPLHAAVVARGEEGVALLGPSGAGKSTTLLRATREAWTPVSEDCAWVDPETLAVARGDLGVRVWPGARDRYAPWLAALPWQPEPDGKTLLPYDALGAPVATGVRLARVALLSAAASDADRVLSPRELAVALWDAAGFALVPANRRVLGAHIARMVERLVGERLPLGRLPLGG